MPEQIGPWTVREELAATPERRTVKGRGPDGRRVVLTIARKGTEAHRLLRRQADVLGKIRHPAIPELLDVFESASHLVIARPWVQGTDLATLARHRRLTEAQVLDLARRLLEVVAHLHALSPRIAHRGISPEHVIRTDEGGIALIGFGALAAEARVTGRTHDGGVTEAGHFPYAPADELIGGGAAADVFAVGVTALHALLGRTPKPADLSAWNKDLNVGIETRKWLAQLLQHDPQERCSAAWAWAHVPTPPPPPAPSPAVLVGPPPRVGAAATRLLVGPASPPALPPALARRALAAPPPVQVLVVYQPQPPPPPPPAYDPVAMIPIAAAAMGIATWLVVGGVAIGILIALYARSIGMGPHLAMLSP